MPMISIHLDDDLLRFLREKADLSGRSVEDLAESAVENAAYDAGYTSTESPAFWDHTKSKLHPNRV